jgi:hypothetical protein
MVKPMAPARKANHALIVSPFEARSTTSAPWRFTCRIPSTAASGNTFSNCV